MKYEEYLFFLSNHRISAIIILIPNTIGAKMSMNIEILGSGSTLITHSHISKELAKAIIDICMKCLILITHNGLAILSAGV